MRWFWFHLSENTVVWVSFVCKQTPKGVLIVQSSKTPPVTTTPPRGPCTTTGSEEQTQADAFELFFTKRHIFLSSGTDAPSCALPQHSCGSRAAEGAGAVVGATRAHAGSHADAHHQPGTAARTGQHHRNPLTPP